LGHTNGIPLPQCHTQQGTLPGNQIELFSLVLCYVSIANTSKCSNIVYTWLRSMVCFKWSHACHCSCWASILQVRCPHSMRQVSTDQHRPCHFHQDTVESLYHIVLLWYLSNGELVNDSFCFQAFLKPCRGKLPIIVKA